MISARRAASAFALSIVAGTAGTAGAHQSSVKYTDLTVDGSRVSITLTIAPSDATGPLGLPDSAQPTVAEVIAPASAGVVSAYVATWFAVSTSGTSCPISDPSAAADADGRFVVIAWTATCPHEISELALDFTRFFAVDQRHEAIVTVHRPAAHGEPIVVRGQDPTITVPVGPRPGAGRDGRLLAIFVGAVLLAGIAALGLARRRRASEPPT